MATLAGVTLRQKSQRSNVTAVNGQVVGSQSRNPRTVARGPLSAVPCRIDSDERAADGT